MRHFVGIDISEPIRARIADYITKLRPLVPDVKWVRPESLHLTLKFTGETGSPAEIERALATVSGNPLELAFHGIGFFSPRSPRVFWVGAAVTLDLTQLAAAVEAAVVPLGVAPEIHPYHPHLTLARTGSGRPQGDRKDRLKPRMYQLRSLVEENPAFSRPDFGTMTATEFCLYRSEQTATESRYIKLRIFEF